MRVINLQTYGVVVISSELTLDAVKALQKHIPSALRLRNEEGDDVFAVSFNDDKASFSEHGICFNKTDSEGKVLLTINSTMSNEQIADEFAAVLMHLGMVEENATFAYSSLQEQLLDIASAIENPDLTSPEVEEAE
jgi:hypothetical protein